MRTKRLERVGMVLLDGMKVRATFFLKGGGYRHHLIDADSATYERLIRQLFYPHRTVRKARKTRKGA